MMFFRNIHKTTHQQKQRLRSNKPWFLVDKTHTHTQNQLRLLWSLVGFQWLPTWSHEGQAGLDLRSGSTGYDLGSHALSRRNCLDGLLQLLSTTCENFVGLLMKLGSNLSSYGCSVMQLQYITQQYITQQFRHNHTSHNNSDITTHHTTIYHTTIHHKTIHHTTMVTLRSGDLGSGDLGKWCLREVAKKWCKSHCNGCRNVAWESCWGGGRSAQHCFFV